jgi:predicted nuclease of predicted toxin-antitoxin system
MELLADECVYKKTVLFLRGKGYLIRTVQEVGRGGCKDPELIKYAAEKGFVLLTRDKDFKDVLKYPPTKHTGLIVLEIHPKSMEDVHLVLAKLLESTENLNKTLVVVDRQKYRLKRM